MFARFSIPDIARSDCGTQFSSSFKKLAKDYDFTHITAHNTSYDDDFDEYDCMYLLLARAYLLEHSLKPLRIPSSINMIISMSVNSSNVIHVCFNILRKIK